MVEFGLKKKKKLTSSDQDNLVLPIHLPISSLTAFMKRIGDLDHEQHDAIDGGKDECEILVREPVHFEAGDQEERERDMEDGGVAKLHHKVDAASVHHGGTR